MQKVQERTDDNRNQIDIGQNFVVIAAPTNYDSNARIIENRVSVFDRLQIKTEHSEQNYKYSCILAASQGMGSSNS